MKLGVLTILFAQQPFEKALDYIAASGLQMVELGAGAYAISTHCPTDRLLRDSRARERFQETLAVRNLGISALSAHGNPLHPNKKSAQAHREGMRKAIRLAQKLGLDTVNGFSGCPGDSERAKYPNWVTCPWPPDYLEVLQWQWEKQVIPHWREEAKFAADHGVRLAFEMHPGFVVYNPETLLRLRAECGDNIGANLDPSHLFWQGIDPIEAIRALGAANAIYHVHAKDTQVMLANVRVNGVLDTKHYRDELNRAWIFRTVGYGHDALFWKDFVSALRMVGYDGTLSIEHEDSLLSVNEGFQKAVALLKQVLLTEPTGQMWWA
ncbi:MAG: sugar phosphate isomerase/epimerase [Candidatus Latescibacteria bacterium]|nr:sugar phosphate isomerase/epimerase [Candidatus Latescibacterota bacterium]